MLGEADLKQLDDLLARSPLALIAWDSASRITFWSRRARDMFGYSSEDVLGKRVDDFDFVAPEDLATVHDVQRSLDSGHETRALVNINRNFRSNGESRMCRWTTFAIQDNERYHILSYVEDITDAMRAQGALAQSEELFRSLFDYNPDVVFVFSADGNIIDANEIATRLTGVSHDELIGRHFSEFVYEEDRAEHQSHLERALQGERLYYHTRVRIPSGRRFDVHITKLPFYRNGAIAGAFSIVRDETDELAAQQRIADQERALADSERRLRSLFEHNPDGVIALSPDGTIEAVNDATLNIGGFTREAVIGRHFSEFSPESDREKSAAAFARALQGTPTESEMTGFRIDGSLAELNVTIIPQFKASEVIGVYSVVQDITERRAAERHAQKQSQRIRDLYFIAASGDYPDVRMRASLEMGCDAFSMSVGALVDVSGDAPRIESLYRNSAADPVDDEIILEAARYARDVEGTASPIVTESSVALRLDVGSDVYGALVFAGPNGATKLSETDIDLLGLISTLVAGAIDRSRQRARLRAMAYYDSLTGLPNRVLASEKLRDAIEVAQSRLSRVAVMFLDLDRFKDANDTLGHARGDRLLQMVARRLVQAFGERATIARMGGDEFVILLADCRDADHARDVAEEVIALVSEPFLLDDYEQFISTSVGVAMYPEDGRDDQTLIKNADIAMYSAKDRGRNAYCAYNPTLEAPIHMRLSQEKLLRRALELDEFLVYYQPQIDLRSGRIVSVEALVRWNHPKSGLIEPGHFIPSAEISGLIVPLGDWILETAATQVRGWCDTLGPLRLAVNLSARQFHQRDVRRRVITTLERTGFDPAMLEIEITETVAMSDAEHTDSVVRDFKAAGIRTAVDDFGTGYSSLAYLRRFALDVLKIDGSFVVGVGHEIHDDTIVRTVIGMAHSLGLEVVAEGVETNAQLAFLHANGCDLVQGYAIAPPLPSKEFEAFFKRERNAAFSAGYIPS